MRFEGFAGNEAAKRQLAADIDAGRFPHALVLEGPQGSGRRTLARLLAKAAVCQGAGDKPCGVCPGCVKAAAGGHPDIIEVGGDGSARSFHIDAVRAVREDAYVLPNEAPRRAILLIGAHNMTEQAQNALLKILEEPPSHVVFLLTCDNRAQLLPTVQSRSVCIPLGGVPEEEALPLLRQRLPDAGEEELKRAQGELAYLKALEPEIKQGEEALAQAEAWNLSPVAPRQVLHRTHIFTHLEWEMTGYVIDCAEGDPAFCWALPQELTGVYALPTAFRQFLPPLGQ